MQEEKGKDRGYRWGGQAKAVASLAGSAVGMYASGLVFPENTGSESAAKR